MFLSVISRNKTFPYLFYSIIKGYFNVLPAAGYRSNIGSSNNLASEGVYWSSTLKVTGQSPYLNFKSSGAGTSENYFAYGFSVRCVQAFTSRSFFLPLPL